MDIEPANKDDVAASPPHEPPSTEPDGPQTLEFAQAQESDDWLDGEEGQLPRRPRMRLLTPVPLALAAVLLLACGFIAGVLVQKGQGGTSGAAGTNASALAARFAALRGGSSSAGAGTGAASVAKGAFAGGFTGAGGAAGQDTAGEVTFVQGNTLYVNTSEGNTVKVKTTAGSSVTKTEKSSVGAIHPGETVIVTGAKGENGTVQAESIRAGTSASAGLSGLFGGGGGGSASAGGTSSSSSAGSESTLFGAGGK